MIIGILSMQQVGNMGSLLQAYALKTILEEFDNQIAFIDIKKIDDDYALLGDYHQEFKDEGQSNNLAGRLNKFDRYVLNRLNGKKNIIKQKKIYQQFSDQYLYTKPTSSQYDLCVIGSDEVFNCLNAGYWGFTSQLFGNVPEAKKVITYAASCGATKYEDLPDPIIKRIRECFRNISGFSARDMNTHHFIASLTDAKIHDHLDPVLVYDFDYEVEDAVMPSDIPEHYCIVYSYYNRIYTSKEINAIKHLCKKRHLTPIAVGAPQFWIKNYVLCSPFQCLKLFKNADFVITDTFHGTIFSVKYAKRFAVLIRESNHNKLSDLINKLGIQQHLVNEIDELEYKYQVSKDSQKVKDIIRQAQKKTDEYLKEYL